MIYFAAILMYLVGGLVMFLWGVVSAEMCRSELSLSAYNAMLIVLWPVAVPVGLAIIYLLHK
jgi:hypothetical protein